jgi:hypothetical protein
MRARFQFSLARFLGFVGLFCIDLGLARLAINERNLTYGAIFVEATVFVGALTVGVALARTLRAIIAASIAVAGTLLFFILILDH